MTDDIAYNRSFDLPPDQVEEVAPGLRRILCNNPGSFTFKGTVSYIVGQGRVAIIDPGRSTRTHRRALAAVSGETVTTSSSPTHIATTPPPRA
jgi:hypothetical protein